MTMKSADTAARLCSACLPALAARGITVPTHARSGAPGVVHLGLGAFHRAHQALVFDALLQGGDARWGVLGVAMRSAALADSLQAQDGLYAVQVASSAGSQWQVGGAIWQTAVAAREPAQVVQAIAAPSTRWLTLTVTEKGYGPELGQLIAQGLAARQTAGLPGLTIASCDNLVGNGRQLQALCMTAAKALNPALADWVAGRCAFPNSMVDRIVPAATPQRLAAAREALVVADEAALGTEAFWEWVIERRFADAADGAVLAAAGVTVVDDVVPFEDAKLRLLNGSHTAMACMGAVAGWPVIGECITKPAVRGFIHGLMTQEVGPQLARPDWSAYRDALLARFANPALQHSVHQIATDSSQKIPQRWPPSVLGALRAGLPVERLAFAAAAWMRYLRGTDEQGQAYAIVDPLGGELQALALAHAGDAAASVQALGTLTAIWGEVLPRDQRWLALVTRNLDEINRLGLLGALAKLQAELDSQQGILRNL
ncbi:mannitol dehydrogenase family protein [Polaromonas eurypsychrophila]|uniref:Mannitol dehydrogenase n=1 Tax=Polaromonas eurypsychrophila TaxID=1614635 RepID=A0A916SFF7_9BURK|nr:mannitol dehydrogenase family protein [Polaromonas eurypsychrophila]GGA94655.1 mannitol dehydrogenase [Polaromonas eurypsychrophila]